MAAVASRAFMGKRKGRQRDAQFTLLGDDEFREKFYDRRSTFDPSFRLKVEAEAKARRFRNVQRRKK